ncbi:BlaI/MecI/CopY family transcriptional regulator [candidate division KSB1 bacterium]
MLKPVPTDIGSSNINFKNIGIIKNFFNLREQSITTYRSNTKFDILIMKNYSFTFNPRKKGIRQILGDLEADIMELLWQKGELTVREVYGILKSDREIAYTTVMTVMSRLSEKGLLDKIKSGSAYIYIPIVSESEFTQSTVKKVMKSLLEDFAAPSINQFIDFFEEDPQKMEELAKLIEKKRKDKDV